MKILFLTLCLSFFYSLLPAQDLNCRVQVLTPAIQSADKQVFTEMEKAIFEFVNNSKWTNEIIQINEKIELVLIINIKEQIGADEFKATAQIQSTRPIYNSSYNSTIFNYSDEEWTFKYALNQNLEYNENENRQNLTSLIAYYINIVIGMDYDSFSLYGGSTYMQKARNIVNLCQSSGTKGWKAFDGTRNRFILVDNLLDNSFKPLREISYRYHRKGLDLMSQNMDNGRQEIIDCLPLLQKVYKSKPNSMLLNVFFSAKTDEMINVFAKALPSEKAKIVQILTDVDATNNAKYQQILRSN